MFYSDVQIFFRVTLIVVFIASFLGKLRNISDFREAILDFRLMPEKWSNLIAWTTLLIELLIVIFLLVGGAFLFIGFIMTICLLTIFSIVLLLALLRKMNVSCNCFGWTEKRISRYDIIRNILFILCGLIGIWTGFMKHEQIWGGTIILLGIMAVCFVLIVTNLADIVETLWEAFQMPKVL